MKMITAFSMVFLFLPEAFAQVQMVTRPERENVELTIYSSRDLTLVREQRNVTLKSGLNILQFSWADTLIDPSSIQLKVVSPKTDISVVSAIIPPNLPNTIQWQVEAKEPVEQALEVSYFTSGLSWNANYIGLIDRAGKNMTLRESVTISNRSGEDYENAQTRLIVGDVRLIEEIRAIAAGRGIEEEKFRARAKAMEAADKALAPVAPRKGVSAGYNALALEAEVAETQAISEYYMYLLEGKDTIKHEWRKKKSAFTIEEIPIKTVHRFGEHGEAVALFYQFKNDEEHKLGKEPLPRGNIKVFVKGEGNSISRLIGETDIDQTPVGKEVKLYMGPDPEVNVKRKQMNIRRVNLQFDKEGRLVRFDTEREYALEIENYKAEDISLEIKENLGRDWEILSSSHKYERKDANSIEYKLNLPPKGKDKITYEVRFLGR